MAFIIGIDPGVHGAIALFDTTARRVTVQDMPDTTGALQDALIALPPVAFAAIEQPYYPKTIGTTNVARIAEAFGRITASLAWRDVPTYTVRPKDWKAALGLSSSKSASREKAGAIFPEDAHQWTRAKDDGRAEAALIAWYGLKWVK